MQGYVPARDEAFAESRKCFGELEEWAASEEAAGLQHADLEEQLEVRGRELLRQLFQDRLNATAAAEERRYDVAGEDGVVRTRAERGRERPLMTKFGQVTVPRIAYRSPGRPNVHAADAALNLPEEKHSHGLRKMAAIEAARGSIEAACAAVTRATGVRIGKRQAEGLVRRAAMDVDAFYLWRVVLPAPDGIPLVLTFDGKGIVMLPDALRPATAKAAAAAESKLATRLSPGEPSARIAETITGRLLRMIPPWRGPRSARSFRPGRPARRIYFMLELFPGLRLFYAHRRSFIFPFLNSEIGKRISLSSCRKDSLSRAEKHLHDRAVRETGKLSSHRAGNTADVIGTREAQFYAAD